MRAVPARRPSRSPDLRSTGLRPPAHLQPPLPSPYVQCPLAGDRQRLRCRALARSPPPRETAALRPHPRTANAAARRRLCWRRHGCRRWRCGQPPSTPSLSVVASRAFSSLVLPRPVSSSSRGRPPPAWAARALGEQHPPSLRLTQGHCFARRDSPTNGAAPDTISFIAPRLPAAGSTEVKGAGWLAALIISPYIYCSCPMDALKLGFVHSTVICCSAEMACGVGQIFICGNVNSC
ncbi:unnamed protein product [Urochloa humidicola]